MVRRGFTCRWISRWRTTTSPSFVVMTRDKEVREVVRARLIKLFQSDSQLAARTREPPGKWTAGGLSRAIPGARPGHHVLWAARLAPRWREVMRAKYAEHQQDVNSRTGAR